MASKISKIKTPQGTTYDIDAKYLNGQASDYYLKEANLQWGGKSFTGGFGPIDAAMIPEFSANRFAFLRPAGITIEYTTDNTNWHDYGDSWQKQALFGTGGSIHIGGPNCKNPNVNTNCKVRVIIDTSLAAVYTVLNKLAINISSNGSGGCYCTIQAAKHESPTVFTTIVNHQAVSGWSGWNVINISPLTTYGNAGSQYQKLIFTFGITSHNPGEKNNYQGLTISRILAFGGFGWTTASNMAKHGKIYSYDSNQNVTFPAALTALSLTSKGYISNPLLAIHGEGSNGIQFKKEQDPAQSYIKTSGNSGFYLESKTSGKDYTVFGTKDANRVLFIQPGTTGTVYMGTINGTSEVPSTDYKLIVDGKAKVNGIDVSTHTHTFSGSQTLNWSCTPTGSITINSYKPEGTITNPGSQTALIGIKTTYSGDNNPQDIDKRLTITFNTANVMKSGTSTFTGTEKAPIGTFKGTTHNHTATVKISGTTGAAK